MFRSLVSNRGHCSLFDPRILLRRRGIKTSVSDLRKGDWIENEGKVLVIQQVSSSFSGRGARQFLIILKEAVSDSLTTIKPSGRDFFEKLELQDVIHQYLYEADGLAHFLNPKTLEEIALPSRLVSGNLGKVIEGGIEVKLRMCGEKPILVHSPTRNFRCTVAEILERRDHGDRPQVVVQIQGGAKVVCPLLVNVGEQIMVNVEDLTYQGRAVGIVQ